MSIVVYELAKSRKNSVSADSSDMTLSFVAMGSTDNVLIRAAVMAVSPRRYLGLRRQKVECDPQGAGYWLCDAVYGFQLATADDDSDPPDPELIGPEWAFDTTGGTQHLTQSKLTVSKTRRGGGLAPDYKRAIGVSKDAVEGVDVFAPKLEFSCTVQKAFTSSSFLRSMASAVGKTNNARWYGFDAGSVLFLGITGSSKPGSRFSITYKFAAGENRTQIELADGLTVPSKKAWEYIWCSYADDVNADRRIQLPVAAYVEKVYDETNFNALFG